MAHQARKRFGQHFLVDPDYTLAQEISLSDIIFYIYNYYQD